MAELQKTFDIGTVPCTFGLNATDDIGFAVARFRARQVLVMCDHVIHERTEIPHKIKKILESGGQEAVLWPRIQPEPTLASIEKAFDLLKQKDFDLFVGVGGGSVLAASKMIALFSSYPDRFYDCLPSPFGQGIPVPGALKPLILLPTTAGTGSEASEVAVVDFFEESGKKKRVGVASKYFLPSLAILDPLNTRTMPPRLTANTGIDALIIAIGAYTARPFHTKSVDSVSGEKSSYKGSNPFTDLLAEKAIQLCGRFLKRSYANGNDLQAREGMLLASHFAGLAVRIAGTHLMHALAFAIGEKIHAAAGLRAGVVTPACLEFLTPFLAERMARIAQLLSQGESHGEKAALSAADAFRGLLAALGAPLTLRELGLGGEDIPDLSERALQEERLILQSPRFLTKKDIEAILKSSL